MSFVNDKETLQRIVSQLAAVDGFAVHAICKSKFIRESLCAEGFRLPLGESNIMDLIQSTRDLSKRNEEQNRNETSVQCSF